jgi:hypothetical protein
MEARSQRRLRITRHEFSRGQGEPVAETALYDDPQEVRQRLLDAVVGSSSS